MCWLTADTRGWNKPGNTKTNFRNDSVTMAEEYTSYILPAKSTLVQWAAGGCCCCISTMADQLKKKWSGSANLKHTSHSNSDIDCFVNIKLQRSPNYQLVRTSLVHALTMVQKKSPFLHYKWNDYWMTIRPASSSMAAKRDSSIIWSTIVAQKDINDRCMNKCLKKTSTSVWRRV